MKIHRYITVPIWRWPLDRLVRIVQDLSKVHSLREVIDIVRVAARQATGADGATFVLRDEGYCFYVDEDAIGPLWKGKRFPLEACISGWSMLHKEPVAIPDIFKDPRIPIEAYKPTFVKSLAMVPIRQSEPIGAIGNYWAKPHKATDSELAILQAIADTTSVAIENVQLLDSLQARVHDLENAHRIKDEFLMLVSHELRTPLNSIMGWSDLLRQGDLSDPSQYRAGLEAIHRNSVRQCQVVSNLLDASNIVLGKFQFNKEELDFLSVVTQAIEEARLSAMKKGVDLVFHKDMEQAALNGDPTRLKQAVDNLMDNAIKFTAKGGRIEVELRKEGPSISLNVKDSGEGIDLEAHPDIFNRFSQTENYITRAHGGLGLGLTITKCIVEAHHGYVDVRSSGLGKGTEFRLSFPLLLTDSRTYRPDQSQGMSNGATTN